MDRDEGATIWFEVNDVLTFLGAERHPTGIQRVATEIIRAARRRFGERVALCRIDAVSSVIEPIPFAWPFSDEPGSPAPTKPRAPLRFQSLRNIVASHLFRRPVSADFARLARKGDALVTLGSPWWPNKSYNRAIESTCRTLGLRYALFVHDIIPLTSPQFVSENDTIVFKRWFETAAALADQICVSSNFVRNDLTGFFQGSPKMPPISILPFGAGFDSGYAKSTDQLDLPERFVLYVSTVEIRKNHKLLLDIWRKLIDRHGANDMPTLVLIGRHGWMVDDLVKELEAGAGLSGKILWLRSVSDAQLAEAYSRCMFTVFPSFVEGWGLPVVEGLKHGKFCIASNGGALSEAGYGLTDNIDPYDAESYLRAIEHAIFDPSYLAGREERIRREFRPASWDDTAQALVAALDGARRDMDAKPA